MDQPEHDEGGGGHERWLVSYADFITLLFAFFTVLYATSNRDMEKTREFQESIKRFLIKAGAFGGSGESINQGEKYNSAIEPPIPTFAPGDTSGQKILSSVEEFVEETFKEKERQKYFRDVTLEEGGVRLVIAADKIFAKNSTRFDPSALGFIDRLAKLLQTLKHKVLIEGHAEKGDVANNTYPSPWEFAAARGGTLVRYLERRYQIDPREFVVISYGDTRPVARYSKESGGNNRIELVILSDESKY